MKLTLSSSGVPKQHWNHASIVLRITARGMMVGRQAIVGVRYVEVVLSA